MIQYNHPMQVYVNEQKTNPSHIIYDEHYYEKYVEGKEVNPFEFRIECHDFNEKIGPKYEELLHELMEDDRQTGENYALELFETLTDYPSYEDILNDTKVSMKEKMNFLNTFFLSQILNEYLGQENNLENKRWVVREILYFNKIDGHIIIKGNVQRIY